MKTLKSKKRFMRDYFSGNGVLEYWSIGVMALGISTLQHSIIPILHFSVPQHPLHPFDHFFRLGDDIFREGLKLRAGERVDIPTAFGSFG